MPFYLTPWENYTTSWGEPGQRPKGTAGISGWGAIDLRPWRDRAFVGSVPTIPTGGGTRHIANTPDDQVSQGTINQIAGDLSITINSRRLGDAIYEVLVARGVPIEPESDGYIRIYLGMLVYERPA